MADSNSRAAALTLEVAQLDGHTRCVLIGEADIASTPMLRAMLDQLIADGQRDVCLNLSALRFIDASTIGAMMQAHERLLALGGRLHLNGVHGMPLRILTICGVLDTLAAEDITEPESEPPHASSLL